MLIATVCDGMDDMRDSEKAVSIVCDGLVERVSDLAFRDADNLILSLR